jgi:hypothetical protein
MLRTEDARTLDAVDVAGAGAVEDDALILSNAACVLDLQRAVRDWPRPKLRRI